MSEPIRKMVLYAGIIEHEKADQLDKEALNFLNIIKDSASSLRSNFAALLEFNEIGTRKSSESFNINKTIQDIIVSHSKECDFRISGLSDVHILAEPNEMFKTFNEVINNAIKFNESVPKIVDIQWKVEEKDVIILFSDNGIGIPESQHERVFKIFQKLGGTKEYPGLGMGLLIVKKIVETHGGKIEIISKSIGTTIKIQLPLN